MLIELKDGTQFEGQISRMREQIMIQMTLECGAQQFLNLTDPAKTAEIIEHLPAKDRIYSGYTVFGQVKLTTGKQAQFYLVGHNAKVEEQWTVPEEYLPEELRSNGGLLT